jgi:hypothetical protein
MKVSFKLENGDDISLSPIKSGIEWFKLELINNRLNILEPNQLIADNDSEIQEKLDELFLQIIEQEQSGTENTETGEIPVSPYDPDAIKVHTKQFSIKLIYDMIEAQDIDLNPDFQRNFVWDNAMKSRLIESILLRIPLPMFYFSEDNEGKITVVDGLQRLTTIKEFMDNKFPLKKLEYLDESCGDCYYTDKNKDGTNNNLKAIDAKYFRWFNMTQFTINVIDPASPSKVKYDIFRRINTGGKPLNNQEIRNCLASRNVRKLLTEMTSLTQFKLASLNSIKSTRMEDQEVALRFICFYNYFMENNNLDSYNGNMEITLDDLVENLNKKSYSEMSVYVHYYKTAMSNASHLFGRYAFRKILPKHMIKGASKQLINKALFVSTSVILSQYPDEKIRLNNSSEILAEKLAIKIESDQLFYNFLSFGTNGKANLQYVFTTMQSLITDHLIIE